MRTNRLKNIPTLLILLVAGCLGACRHQEPEGQMLQIIFTGDVRGAILPYDFKRDTISNESLANISSFVNDMREIFGPENILVLDNGGNLTGRVVPYYSNYVDSVNEPLYYRAERLIGYDAIGIGNHDMDVKECLNPTRISPDYQRPVVCANLLDSRTREPYFEPYLVFERGGLKVAVLGMASPGVSAWLPKQLWKNVHMQDMVECAEKWVPYIQEHEHPDILIGLFSCGRDYTDGDLTMDSYKNPNAGLIVARHVPGFDLVILGKDKDPQSFDMRNEAGQFVRIINVGERAKNVGSAIIHVTRQKDGSLHKRILTNLSRSSRSEVDPAFVEEFAQDFKKIHSWMNDTLGYLSDSLYPLDRFYTPSFYRALIHKAQLWHTKADISVTGIITSADEIPAGPLTMRDLIDVDDHEAQIVKLRMTGDEIYRMLEYTYGQQIEQVNRPGDFLLSLRHDPYGHTVRNDAGQPYLRMPPSSFLSCAGIVYTVDVRKPAGQRVTIHSMHDGTPFDLRKSYTVAINSYHGSGGDGILTRGVGWNKETLDLHSLPSDPYNMREMLADYLQKVDTFHCVLTGDFNLVPEDFVSVSLERAKTEPAPVW